MALVIAHRGASAAERENTVAAFRKAAELGADWVELDVRMSADGVLVVHHDATVDDGRAVGDVVAGDLPAHVPTLAEALDACADGGLAVNVEIKALPGEPDEALAPAIARAVVELLQAGVDSGTWAPARLLVTCFDPTTLARVASGGGSRLATGLLTLVLEGWEEVVATAVAGGHRAINPWDATTTAELVAGAHDAGLAVNVWTVDDPERMAELVAMGVDGLITNVPDVGRAVVDGRAG
jgi:glycerophosphoryl diester phosphodiesterase